MGLQLIFVVETNKKCNSDWIYIKDTIEEFCTYDKAHVKLTPIYMGGKGNYKIKEKEVLTKIREYAQASRNNKSEVIYCFDCDDYDSNPEDKKFMEESKQFCEDKGYEYCWFCKDIERVYLGKKVNDSDKKRRRRFLKQRD